MFKSTGPGPSVRGVDGFDPRAAARGLISRLERQTPPPLHAATNRRALRPAPQLLFESNGGETPCGRMVHSKNANGTTRWWRRLVQCLGNHSPSRTRTYNLLVNSQPLYH